MKTEKNSDEYNGWTNYSTWAVTLHWDNNEGDYQYCSEQAKRFKGGLKEPREFGIFLKDLYTEIFDSVIEGNATKEAKLMVRDVGNGDNVDWEEIAEAYYKKSE
jgi:hypothetical protein